MAAEKIGTQDLANSAEAIGSIAAAIGEQGATTAESLAVPSTPRQPAAGHREHQSR